MTDLIDLNASLPRPNVENSAAFRPCGQHSYQKYICIFLRATFNQGVRSSILRRSTISKKAPSMGAFFAYGTSVGLSESRARKRRDSHTAKGGILRNAEINLLLPVMAAQLPLSLPRVAILPQRHPRWVILLISHTFIIKLCIVFWLLIVYYINMMARAIASLSELCLQKINK